MQLHLSWFLPFRNAAPFNRAELRSLPKKAAPSSMTRWIRLSEKSWDSYGASLFGLLYWPGLCGVDVRGWNVKRHKRNQSLSDRHACLQGFANQEGKQKYLEPGFSARDAVHSSKLRVARRSGQGRIGEAGKWGRRQRLDAMRKWWKAVRTMTWNEAQ